jgi:hypothetical protein
MAQATYLWKIWDFNGKMLAMFIFGFIAGFVLAPIVVFGTMYGVLCYYGEPTP